MGRPDNEGGMANRVAILAILLTAGCRAPVPCCRVAPPAPPAPVPELQVARPALPAFEPTDLPKPTVKLVAGFAPGSYRELSESLCQSLGARNSSLANTLDDENRIPSSATGCDADADKLRRAVRHFAALEARNLSAAAALDRYFQLADAETRAAVTREAGPVLNDLFKNAADARAAKVRYPLDPDDVDRQRGQLASQLEQADAGARAMNIDLRRRLGLPPSADERIWPTGDFPIDAEPADETKAVAAALADRPELRALRTLHQGLSVNTLPVAREFLGVPAAVGGPASVTSGLFGRCLAKLLARRSKPDPCAEAELDVRRKQLADLIATRERDVADQTRVAVVALNAQARRVGLARERLDGWAAKLEEAKKQREVGLPLADLNEAQVRLEWLKARAELVAETTAWHQARIRLKAAMGWLVWETVPVHQ